MQAGYLGDRPLGYVQDVDLAASSSLGTIPAGATTAMIVAEGQAVRWRDDGTDPTAAVGMPLAVGVPFVYTGALSRIRFIEQAGGASLNIAFYGAN